MRKESYRIISALYKILGDYNREDIAEASRQIGLPPGLRAALRALIEESDRSEPDLFSKSGKPRRGRETRREDGTTNGHGRTPSLSPKLPGEIYKRNLQAFLNSKSRFKNKQDLINFASKLGFQENVSSKASRQRVEQKITSFALNHPEFREKLYQIVPNDWSKQTSGWLELILGSKQ
jgi:hypothetical protein